LPGEETARGTYPTSKALAYESSTFEFGEYYEEALTSSFPLILSFLAT
jgi:hypothetical protein